MSSKLFSAVILSGGNSSRMGFDKQMLSINGKSLFENNILELRKTFAEIIIVTNKPELYEKFDVKVVSDKYLNCGPLGGIHAGLQSLDEKAQYAYLLACDMPCISASFVEYLMHQIQVNKYDACVSMCDGKMQPFNSVYNKSILPVVESDLIENKTSLYKLVNKVNTLYIPEETVLEFKEGKEMFINLNTVEELENYSKKIENKETSIWKSREI